MRTKSTIGLSFVVLTLATVAGCHIGEVVDVGGDGAAACPYYAPGWDFPDLDAVCSMPRLWATNSATLDCTVDDCFQVTQACLDEMENTVAGVVEGTPSYGSAAVKTAFLTAMQQLLYGPMAREAGTGGDPETSALLPPSGHHVDTSTLCFASTKNDDLFYLGLIDDIPAVADMAHPIIHPWDSSFRNPRHYQFVFQRLHDLKITSTTDTSFFAKNHKNKELILAPGFGNTNTDVTFRSANLLLHELIHGLGDDFFAAHHLGSNQSDDACPIPGAGECDQTMRSAYGMGIAVQHALILGYQNTRGHIEDLQWDPVTGGIIDVGPDVRASCEAYTDTAYELSCIWAQTKLVDVFDVDPPSSYDCDVEATSYLGAHAVAGTIEPSSCPSGITVSFLTQPCGNVAGDITAVSLDPTSSTITVPQALYDELLSDPEVLTNSEYAAGVGVSVTQDAAGADVITFTDVATGSLADRAGIVAGDRLTHVNGASASLLGLVDLAQHPELVESFTVSRPVAGGAAQSITMSLRAEGGGCAAIPDVQAEQVFTPSMVGCAGQGSWENRSRYCHPDWHVCGPDEFVARNFDSRVTTDAPAYHYWTDADLRYSGSNGSCSVSVTSGTACSSPMRVCAPSASGDDPLGNHCNWQGCGYEGSTDDRYFGGCAGNVTAGTLCCK